MWQLIYRFVQTYRHFMYHVVEVRIIALTDVWLEVSLGKTESPLNPSSDAGGFFEEKNLTCTLVLPL